jgi:hypothetical protein
MSLTVEDGALITLDPNDQTVLSWDWDAKHLGVGVTINTSAFTLTAISPTTATGITKDNPSILTASPYNSRWTQIRVLVGGDSALGQLFELANTITSSEAPSQSKERSIRLLVQQK